MFKITRNTVHRFSLAEVFLIAAMNQMHMKRKQMHESGREDQVGVGMIVHQRQSPLGSMKCR